ncbi:hypothetical protein U1Q18_003015 [Sarracenia purpurea var. burkii]
METKKMESDQKTPYPSICGQTKGNPPTLSVEEKSWKEEDEYGNTRPKRQNLPLRGHQYELVLPQPEGNKNLEDLLPHPGAEKEYGISSPSDLNHTELSRPNQFPLPGYPPDLLTEAKVKPSVRKRKAWARQIRQTPGTAQQITLCSKRHLDEDIPLSTPNLAKKAKTQTNLLSSNPSEPHAHPLCQ